MELDEKLAVAEAVSAVAEANDTLISDIISEIGYVLENYELDIDDVGKFVWKGSVHELTPEMVDELMVHANLMDRIETLVVAAKDLEQEWSEKFRERFALVRSLREKKTVKRLADLKPGMYMRSDEPIDAFSDIYHFTGERWYRNHTLIDDTLVPDGLVPLNKG